MKFVALDMGCGIPLFITVLAALSRPQAHMRVFFDGEEASLRSPPIIRGGKVFLGMREVFSRLGAGVFYAQSTRKITVFRGEENFIFTVGSSQADANGRKVALSQRPVFIGKSLYVPLRVVSEILGAKARFEPQDRSVHIDTSDIAFFHEKPPFKRGDAVLFRHQIQWIPATITDIKDYADGEDIYWIQFINPANGVVVNADVGRRFIRAPKRATKPPA